jgi:hypothetical protein
MRANMRTPKPKEWMGSEGAAQIGQTGRWCIKDSSRAWEACRFGQANGPLHWPAPEEIVLGTEKSASRWRRALAEVSHRRKSLQLTNSLRLRIACYRSLTLFYCADNAILPSTRSPVAFDARRLEVRRPFHFSALNHDHLSAASAEEVRGAGAHYAATANHNPHGLSACKRSKSRGGPGC